MPTFKDKGGREWVAEVSLDMIPALRECGLDLSKIAAEKDAAQLDALLLDPERFGRILWTLCGEQAEAAGIDPRAFARGFNADTLADATDAVLLAVSDVVYRRPELRKLIREELPKLWAKAEAQARAKAGAPPAGYVG